MMLLKSVFDIIIIDNDNDKTTLAEPRPIVYVIDENSFVISIIRRKKAINTNLFRAESIQEIERLPANNRR